jgi:hypothetical protein
VRFAEDVLALYAQLSSLRSYVSDARKFLEDVAIQKKSGAKHYITIKGKRYDRAVIDKARFFSKDGSISENDAKILWDCVQVGSAGIINAYSYSGIRPCIFR